jgi:hypothetical protein
MFTRSKTRQLTEDDYDDRGNTAASVWADSAYRSRANLVLPARRGLRTEFQHKKPRGMAIRRNRSNCQRKCHADPHPLLHRARLRCLEAPSRPRHSRHRHHPGAGQRSVSSISRAISPGWLGTTGEEHPHDRQAAREAGPMTDGNAQTGPPEQNNNAAHCARQLSSPQSPVI